MDGFIKDMQKQADKMRQERAVSSNSVSNNNNNQDDSLTTFPNANNIEYEYNLALQSMTSDVLSITDM